MSRYTIKSVSDVITNSSSEVFIISNPRISVSELRTRLKEYRETYDKDKTGSGMGGILKVNRLKEDFQRWPEDCYKLRIPCLPDSIILEIDHAFQETIKYLKKGYEGIYDINEETLYPIWSDDGEKILRLTKNYQEWKSLEDPLKMHGKWAFENEDWWNYEDKD